MKTKLSRNLISEKWLDRLRQLSRYGVLIFIVFVAVLYSRVFLHINNLNDMQPSDSAVSSQIHSANLPTIGTIQVQKIESLQDNSVSVQTLFDQARNNPFVSP
jgi:hypothetical protein